MLRTEGSLEDTGLYSDAVQYAGDLGSQEVRYSPFADYKSGIGSLQWLLSSSLAGARVVQSAWPTENPRDLRAKQSELQIHPVLPIARLLDQSRLHLSGQVARDGFLQ